MIFADREDAGRQLVGVLQDYADRDDAVVLGLPRGGVVIAAEVAKELHLPLDIVVPRKIGCPGNPELAIGAVSEEGRPIFHEQMLQLYEVSEEYLRVEVEKERQESRRRLKLYRGDKPDLSLKGKTAIVVDDGIATGATMMAAIASCRSKGAREIIVVVPVIASDTLSQFENQGDKLIYLEAPTVFGSVGRFYKDFPQVSDEEVIELMEACSSSGVSK